MSKMSDDEIIEVVEAHRNGKQIQYYTVYGWSNTNCPSWDFESKEYRIKPEIEKLRPFKDLREFHGYWKKAHDNSVSKGSIDIGGIWLTRSDSEKQYLVTAVDWKNDRLFVAAGYWVNLEELTEYFKFSDGSPCGVVE